MKMKRMNRTYPPTLPTPANRLMIAGLLFSFCHIVESRGQDGGFEQWEFSDRAGGGTFGGGGFGGGDAQRYGGSGIGDGHFGGGGLGSVRASQDDSSAARDWQDRGNQLAPPTAPQPENMPWHDSDYHAGGAYYSRGGYYYGGAFLPFYYGGSWGGYYNGMMMGELAGLNIGSSVASLPRSHDIIMVDGTPYYYSNGVYMIRQTPASSYTLVPPPPGAIVNYLPNNCAPVYLGSQVYQDCNGAFYQQTDQGWRVIQPPAGIHICHIPSGAVGRELNGIQYFEYGGVWYQPFYGGSDIIYRIVSNPKD